MPNFVVQMRTRGSARSSHITNYLRSENPLADFDVHFGEMAIASDRAELMIDHYNVSISFTLAGINYDTVRGSVYRAAIRS